MKYEIYLNPSNVRTVRDRKTGESLDITAEAQTAINAMDLTNPVTVSAAIEAREVADTLKTAAQKAVDADNATAAAARR